MKNLKNKIKNYLKLFRIKHYLKNFLIFLPLIFSGNLFKQSYFDKCLIGIIIFSSLLISSTPFL